jgi:hypothetical protein
VFRQQMEHEGRKQEDWEQQHCLGKREITSKLEVAAKRSMLGTADKRTSEHCEEYLSHAVQV